MHMSFVDLYKGQVSLAYGYVLQETRPKIIDIKISTFTFTTSCFVSKRCIYLINYDSL